MAAAAVVHNLHRQAVRRERVFRDRENPLDYFNDDQLRERFRFRRHSILFILQFIINTIQPPTNRSHSIPALFQLLITLGFVAIGLFMFVVRDTIPRISKATVSRVIRRVTVEITRLAGQFVQFPNGRRLEEVKKGFFQLAGMPNVIGAIDCTHVHILAPTGAREPDFVNRKGRHSLNVQ
ncbi:putative nuclease HARBI1, partial [Lingula anatina]|uniref:Nuclease HARBI1 n=1 Tax=Lingula anatina TaxID=7574 RepID=A0A1S3J1R3_LINAN